jgi:ribosomal protein L32
MAVPPRRGSNIRTRRLRTCVQGSATNRSRGESCANDADPHTQQHDSDSDDRFDGTHPSMRRRVKTGLVHTWDRVHA